MHITVIGSTFVDIKGYPDTEFLPHGKNMGQVEQVHGGVSRNIAEDIANIGLPCAFVSLVDESGIGTDVIERLKMSGIDTEYVRRTKDGMGTWLAVFDHTGDVFAAISKRPDLLPIADILDHEGDRLFQNTKCVLIEADAEKETAERVLKLAKKYDRPVYVCVPNMNITQQSMELAKQVDCFVCNNIEAGLLFGEDLRSMTPEDVRKLLAQKVAEEGIRSMIVTLGEDGSVWAKSTGENGICEAIKTRVKDTTGAGDAYFAGVCGALSCGKTMAEACAVGSRIATSVLESTENVCPKFATGELGLCFLEE